MSLLPLALVLAGAVTHAAWNLTAKQAGGGSGFVGAYTLLSAVLLLPAAAVWLLIDPARPTWAWLWAGAVSGVLHLGYALVLQRSYAWGDLNLTYPVSRAVGPLLTLLVAIALLGEVLSPLALLGALALLLGVSVIGWPSARVRLRDDAALRAGLALGTATGVMIAGYTLWDDHTVNALHVPALPYYLMTGLTQLVAMAPLLWRGRTQVRSVWRTHPREAVAVAALVPFSYVLVLVAMTMAPVGLVASLRATSIVLAALGSWLILREPSPGRRLVGAVIVVGGVALIGVG